MEYGKTEGCREGGVARTVHSKLGHHSFVSLHKVSPI